MVSPIFVGPKAPKDFFFWVFLYVGQVVGGWVLASSAEPSRGGRPNGACLTWNGCVPFSFHPPPPPAKKRLVPGFSKERVLDQAQAQAPYTSPFLGGSFM